MVGVANMSILEAVIPGIASQVESFRRSDNAREELLLVSHVRSM